MRYYQTIVEQLDRAASELGTDHPINNRLALILIDNAVELIVHRLCHKHVMVDGMFSGYPSPEDTGFYVMTESELRKANGRYLKPKLRILVKKGDLNPRESRFIAIVHKYRNELYHVGLTHDDIIRAVANQYYLFCCDFFARTGNASVWAVTVPSNGSTEVMDRYLPEPGTKPYLQDVDDEVVADKLRHALPNEMPDLAETLSDSAIISVENIMDGFEFLVRDNPRGMSANEILELVQWQREFRVVLDKEKIDGHFSSPTYQREYIRLEREFNETWTQEYKKIPELKWRRRAEEVKDEADPLIAMDRYQTLRDEMAYLEEAIDTMATELDRWIQQEIDRIRGK